VVKQCCQNSSTLKHLLEGGWEKGKEKEEDVEGAKSEDPSMELRGLLKACVYAGRL
jgi:hypothetical protein